MDEDPKPSEKTNDDELAKYNLDDYDKESQSIASGPFSNIKGLTYYKNNDEDPYITLKEVRRLFALDPCYPVNQRYRTMKSSNVKSSRYSRRTIFSSPQKHKTKFHSSKSMYTTNLKKTYTCITI